MANEYRHQVDPGLGGISSVVSSLPAGYTLGEARMDAEIKYRLVFNAGGEQVAPGEVAVPALSGAGPYSVTVTSTSQGNGQIGGVVCHHATATTDTFFWGVTRGRLASGLVGDAASTSAGAFFAVGSNGAVNLMPQSVVTGKNVIGVAIVTITTAARTGDVYVTFE